MRLLLLCAMLAVATAQDISYTLFYRLDDGTYLPPSQAVIAVSPTTSFVELRPLVARETRYIGRYVSIGVRVPVGETIDTTLPVLTLYQQGKIFEVWVQALQLGNRRPPISIIKDSVFDTQFADRDIDGNGVVDRFLGRTASGLQFDTRGKGRCTVTISPTEYRQTW